MTSNNTAESTPPASLNSPSIIPSSSSSSTTVNNGNNVNEIQIQNHPPSSPSSSPLTPTPQLSTSHPSSDIEDVIIDPSTMNNNNALTDNARSAASISNLINHDEEQLQLQLQQQQQQLQQQQQQQQLQQQQQIDASSPTSQISSRSITPAPETPLIDSNNDQSSMDIEFNNTNKKRKDHDNDEKNNGDFDSPKRQRRNLKNLTLSSERISDEISSKVDSNLTSPILDEMMIDDHNSDDGTQISSSSSSLGNNINFATKQTRKKPYIPRPPNSFILYRQHHHPLILNQHPGINNSEISRIIADHWRNLSNQEKEEWKRKAEEAKQRHMKAWPDYKYQPRRRVVGPTFKKPLKGPDTPSSATKSDFSAQEGMMDNFVIELSSPRKNDTISRERPRFPGKSVIIIEGGSKELKDRNGNNNNNNSRKLSPAEAIKAKLGTPTHQIPTYSSHSPHSQRLPPPCTLVPQLQQPPPSIVHPPTHSSSSTSTVSASPCGALIVLEGCEDSTTKQSTQLYDFLKNEGIKAKLWKFPDTSTPSGSALKAYQSTNRQPHPKTLHLLVAAHWWELMPTMKEHLINGVTLIVDRYVYSSMAESAAAGLDLAWCKSSYSQVLSPDLIFFLNVEREAIEMDKQQLSQLSQLSSQLSQLSLPHVNDILGISNSDSDDGRAKEWQRRVQDALSKLADSQWKVLDAHKSNTIIKAQIITASVEAIERCRNSTGYSNMFNGAIMPHQNQQLPPLGPSASSPPSSHSLSQQQNSNVLPPLVRGGGYRSVHVQL